jgi:hypothetical protein
VATLEHGDVGRAGLGESMSISESEGVGGSLNDSGMFNNVDYRRVWPWLGLGCVLIVYLISVLELHPANFFGLTQDDTMYFSSAQALSQGKGYILPNLPWTPPATKYPILYPWILSWVWRWSPSFPSNLNAAVALSVLFGMAYVSLAFVFFRQFRALSLAETLLLTAFCALQPSVLLYSGSILSDIPFSAFALAAMLLANAATKRDAPPARAVTCGMVAGVALLVRTLGVPLVAGILAAALFRRAWRQAAFFSASVAPFFLWGAWQVVRSTRSMATVDLSHASPGFVQTWTFYLSYIGMRRLNLGDLHLFGSMLGTQVIYLFAHVAGFFLGPLLEGHLGLSFLTTILVLWILGLGIVHGARQVGWQPVHFALPFYALVILAWDFVEVQRFLIPFLPLFAVSFWLGGKWIASELVATLRRSRSLVERSFAATFGMILAILALGLAWNLAANHDRAKLRLLSRTREALLVEKLEAYNWLRRNSAVDARVIAGEDGSVYLYTNRQSMSYMVLSRIGLFDPTRFRYDLDHITDVAREIHAAYWMAIPNDNERQWVSARIPLESRLLQVESVLPEVFRSGAGHVHIYALPCIRHPEDPACEKADRVLFPSHTETDAKDAAVPGPPSATLTEGVRQ